MGLGKALKKAAGKVKQAVTSPVKATKQLAKGDVKGSLKTAIGAVGAPSAVAPAGQGGIAQDIFAGAPAVPAGMGVAGAIARGGFTGMKQRPAPRPAPMAAPLGAAPAAVGNMAGMLAGQFGAPARKPMQPGGFGMGGFDMGGGY